MVFCDGAADARDPTLICGKEALKLAISSSFGFCELVLRMGEMSAGWSERDAQAGASTRKWLTDCGTCLESSAERVVRVPGA